MSLMGVLENLLSDAIFLLLAIFLGWVIFQFFRRNKKLEFFQIKETRRIVIYVANLRVRKCGAIGIDNQIRSYAGQAIAYKEIQCANQFRDFFNYLIPSLADRPGILSKLLISDVKVEIAISPLTEAQLEKQASFITFGSPAYNMASQFLHDKHLSKVTFRFGKLSKKDIDSGNFYSPPTGSSQSALAGDTGYAGGTAELVFDLPGDTGPSGPPISHHRSSFDETIAEQGVSESEIIIEGIPPFTQTTYGFIECIVDKDANRKLFYVAGLSEVATAGAAYHLISHWSSLEKKYGKRSQFIRMVNVDPTDYTKSTIVFER